MDAALEMRHISLIHQGVVDPKRWDPFICALREAMGAAHANLTFRRTDAPMSDLTSYVSGGPTEEMSRVYLGRYHRADPLPYYRLKAGLVYDLADMFAPGEESGLQRLKQLLKPFGEAGLLMVRITEPGGANAWLTAIRADPAFGGEDRKLLQRLGEHLAIALGTYVKLSDTEARLAAYTKAMDRLNVGIVTLAGDGRIIDADALVSSLISKGEIMARDPQGRLLLGDRGAGRVLAAALRDFAREPAGRPRAVRLGEATRADILLLPVADRPVTGRFTPVLRAYVHTDHRPASDSLENLIEMYHLTRSEARLALALGEGHTLAEAAAKLGVTVQTARTYSKRVFQKTGTRRQAELVRTLLTSTLSLV